jgi:bifunctional non-homologous end joining protein LigD
MAGHAERIHFYAFDLMYLDGYDLRDATLIDRKAALLHSGRAHSRPVPLQRSSRNRGS